MRSLCTALALLAGSAVAAESQVHIPYEAFTLDNGLRVIVHTDRKAPIVAVNVWYHVGSKNELPGRTGFAHLFEHLMFEGSENHRDEYLKPFELVGATGMNGTTSVDRTNYFQNVPTTALDLALWMESDRMGHFLGAIQQAALDEQRGVVQNEKRQGDNQPYGQVWDLLLKATYPDDHPYRHSTIGSMADLNAATLDDVRWWFKSWYGPNNAVLVLAGDIDVDTARSKVTRYFGDIPAGPSQTQPPVSVPQRSKATREEAEDRVAQTRIYRTWSVPEYGTAELTHLRLLSQILAGSAASRLERRLVHEERLADSVGGSVQGQQLVGSMLLAVDVKQGVEPERVESILDQELARLLDQGPSQEELDRARTVARAGFVRRIERIGGFGGKADVLAECAVYLGDPGCYRAEWARMETATPTDLQAAGRRWLARERSHTLVVKPGQRTPTPEDERTAEPAPLPALPEVDSRYGVVASDVDRSLGPPITDQFPELSFPTLQRQQLDNGLRVILARREGLPLVQMSLELGGGYSADAGRKLGTSSFTMAMLDEGAGELDPLSFRAAAEALGANIGSTAGLDSASVRLSALRDRLEPSLALYADTVLRPRFDAAEIERVRAQWLAQIAQEKTHPGSLAMRLLPPLLYGAEHAYGIPFTGSGTEASVMSLNRDDLLAFHREWLRPDNATLIVVGDLTMTDLLPLLERHFGAWRAPEHALPELNLAQVAAPKAARVYLIDQPGASQATILFSQLIPPSSDAASLAFDIGNDVFGGIFTSRINTNLREDKGWSYGASSSASNAVGQRPWFGYASVQIDQTAPSIAEIQRELAGFLGEHPATEDEIAKIRASRIHRMPGAFEAGSAVLGAISGIVRYQRPDDDVQTLKARVEGTDDDAVHAAVATLNPAAMTWIVVGDLSQIEAPVRQLNIGPVRILDGDGQAVESGQQPARISP